jgi:hypothetical protein
MLHVVIYTLKTYCTYSIQYCERICFILCGSDDCVTFEPVDSILCAEISYTVLQEHVWAPS